MNYMLYHIHTIHTCIHMYLRIKAIDYDTNSGLVVYPVVLYNVLLALIYVYHG